ncbi:hypothetical protein DV736_g4939, partial [Chaetothyriales sp. CBS 134916]
MADVDLKESPFMAPSDSSEDESDLESVELLVTGRERRKTAGNRYNRDMVLEEVGDQDDPDEVALLFASGQDEEDDEFKSDAAEDDEMSSSDDDDQGPNAGAIRKRPKIDPAAAKQPLSKKPSKKKERVTWLPDQDAGGRASLRKQTVAHREHTLARLRESEAQSKKLKALKAIRDRERAKDAPKAMTQADRLAEAERVERRNAKSLNRWEAMEKKRTEEQAAKLAALKERKLEGPVITWWSGKTKWRRPQIIDTGMDGASPVDSSGEPKKRGRKPKALHEQLAAGPSTSIPTTPTSHAQPSPLQQSTTVEQQPRQQQQPQTPHPAPTIESMPAPPAPPKTDSSVLLPGIHEFANIPDDATTGSATGDAAVSDTPLPGVTAQDKDAAMVDVTSYVATPLALDASQTPTQCTSSATGEDQPKSPMQLEQINKALVAAGPQVRLDSPSTSACMAPSSAPGLSVQIPAAPPEPMVEEFTTKNLVVLDKFDDLSEQARLAYSVFFRSKRVPRPAQRRPELCPITTQVARYKDPATGIGYANLMAHKVLQELKEHKFIWSAMLGCYVGRDVPPPASASTDCDSTPRLRLLDAAAADAETVTMPASFLQFCAMCEKQITHPLTKILYCSEACRNKDDAKPLSASTLPSSYLSAGPPSSPLRSTSLLHEAAAPYSSTPSIRIPPDAHTFKPDLDPTEWKPKLSSSSSLPRTHSDAYRYLSRFHMDNNNALNPSGNGYVRVDRPSSAQRRKHMNMHMHTKSLTTTPSLASTPTTAASSLSSTASAIASRSLDVSYDRDFPTRPLNSRTNPLYAISPAAKTTDLVTPHIVPALGSAGEMTWEKKPISEPMVKQSALSKEFL